MSLKDDAVWLIFDPWNEQPKPCPCRKSDCDHYHGNYPDGYIDGINKYFAHKIDEYMQDIKTKYVVINSDEREKHGLSDVFKDYNIIEHHEVPNITKDYESIVYTGFHHGRCTIDRSNSGAKEMKMNRHQPTHLYFKTDLLCCLPGDSWIKMDKISQEYGELI